MSETVMPKFGTGFHFPENSHLEYGDSDYEFKMLHNAYVEITEQYNDAVVNEIAQAARLTGATSCLVLNKTAIMEALRKQQPEKVRNGTCPHCHRIFLFRYGEVAKGPYCDNCGQALDWEVD